MKSNDSKVTNNQTKDLQNSSLENNDYQTEEVFAIKLISGSLMAILSLTAVILGLLNLINFAMVAMTMLGLVMASLPFPTPQTVELFGEEKAKIFTRAAGVVLFVAGIIGYFKV